MVPSQPAKPRDKAVVEGAVWLAQRWILARLRNQTFFDLGALNEALRVFLDAFNDRPMKQLRDQPPRSLPAVRPPGPAAVTGRALGSIAALLIVSTTMSSSTTVVEI